VDRTLGPKVNEALLGRWEPIYRSRLHYLVTWSTRGRKPVLKDRHLAMLGEMVAGLCDERSITLLESPRLRITFTCCSACGRPRVSRVRCADCLGESHLP